MAHLLDRKQTHFVLWRPGQIHPAPSLYIGPIATAGGSWANFRDIPLQPSATFPEIWEVAAQDCDLADGVYAYWFKVARANPYQPDAPLLYCTDPLAYTVDRRFIAPPIPGSVASYQPASIILVRSGQLIPCDPGGQTVDWTGDAALSSLPPNHQLVIYELPTRWAQIGSDGRTDLGTGTFKDVMALLGSTEPAPDFSRVEALQADRHYLKELGVNALELLPPEDSGDRDNRDKYKWGYGTANYCAADFDLGHPGGQSAPTASVDLAELIKAGHQQGIRFFLDVVMAFSRDNPYTLINFLDFYVQWGVADPEQGDRDGFGGDLFKYNNALAQSYDPFSGDAATIVPAREYMKLHLAHWMNYYRIDGLRLDSVNNVRNFDFLQQFKDKARELWGDRGGSDDRFLVVGEELSVPLSLVHQNRLDGLWNEKFKQMVRRVLLGQPAWDEPSFEWTVRKLIDCRLLGFRQGVQAVNYLTSHDVGGFGNERLFNFLMHNGVYDTEKRIKLAFVCLLTAVGIPMILAGEEFADQHDLDITNEHGDNKQVDPVNYSRVEDDWRRRIFDYVARLVHLRKTSAALAVDDTAFIHGDFTSGKRVMAWKRGYGTNLVVVVANFSDYGTPNPMSPSAEYVVPRFPVAPSGHQWYEVTQSRWVPEEWIGREPVFDWEAKVYELRPHGAEG